MYLFQTYGKFGSISLGHFIKHKPLISEECGLDPSDNAGIIFFRYATYVQKGLPFVKPQMHYLITTTLLTPYS